MIKKIDLELGREFLNEEKGESTLSKRAATAEKNRLKELREKHPVKIEVVFKYPWWAIDNSGDG